ncbi:hypothetical protein A6R68_14763 [Neotoma lepida]|uniref:Cation channel sperm-associated auxiliary subunit delta n=1 Tax=Neotoma lepida TaxID=56216 RepID=A0A1A6H9X7_NEOLE|nr:hypothetical protein A6R68_14763 [Neotoma lepida]
MLFYAFPTTSMVRHICQSHIVVYLGKKIFMSKDNFESSLPPLIIPKSMAGTFNYMEHPLNHSAGIPFKYNESLDVIIKPGQRGFLILWSERSLLVSPNSGQIMETVQLWKGKTVVTSDISATTITIHSVASTFDFQKCTVNVQAVLKDPSLQIEPCNVMVSNPHSLGLEARIIEFGNTFDGNYKYKLEIELKQQQHWENADLNFTSSIKRNAISSITVDIADKTVACVDLKPLSTLISVGCDQTKKILVQNKISACSMGILDPVELQRNYTYTIEKQSDPNFKNRLQEQRKKQKLAKERAGLSKLPDLKDAEAVQKFFLEEIQFGEELLAQGEYEKGVDHLTNAIAVCGQPQQLLQVLQQTLPPPVFQMLLTKLPTISQRIWCPPWNLTLCLRWKNGILEEIMNAEYVITEVNGIITYSYSLTAASANCQSQPQNWSTFNCHVDNKDNPLLWPEVEYQILGGQTDNRVIFGQRNGIYTFLLSVVDPYYSYCSLDTMFSVYVYGALPVALFPPVLSIVLLVFTTLLSVWLAYAIPKELSTERGQRFKESCSLRFQRCLGFCSCPRLGDRLQLWLRSKRSTVGRLSKDLLFSSSLLSPLWDVSAKIFYVPIPNPKILK